MFYVEVVVAREEMSGGTSGVARGDIRGDVRGKVSESPQYDR